MINLVDGGPQYVKVGGEQGGEGGVLQDRE